MVRSRYPTLGAKKLSKLLPGRTASAVQSKAKEFSIALGDIDGFVGVRQLADITGMHIVTVRERVLASGYAKKVKSGSRVHIIVVPVAWADAYVRMVERGKQNDELEGHYYNTEKVARIFGVTPRTIRKWVRGERKDGLGLACMNRIKVIATTGHLRNRYLFEPRAAEREAKRYRDRYQRGGIRPFKDKNWYQPVDESGAHAGC